MHYQATFERHDDGITVGYVGHVYLYKKHLHTTGYYATCDEAMAACAAYTAAYRAARGLK